MLRHTRSEEYYRIKGKDGVYYGGPMYYIERGMGKKWKPLAIFFAVTIILGGLGTAAFAQPYTMSTALERTFHIPAWVVTVAAAAICGIVLIGGVKGIGKFCEKITPAMCLIYVVGALGDQLEIVGTFEKEGYLLAYYDGQRLDEVLKRAETFCISSIAGGK